MMIVLIDRDHCQASAGNSVHEFKEEKSGQHQHKIKTSPSSRRPRESSISSDNQRNSVAGFPGHTLSYLTPRAMPLQPTSCCENRQKDQIDATNRTDHALRHSTSHCGRTGRIGQGHHVRRVHHGSWNPASQRSWGQWVR